MSDNRERGKFARRMREEGFEVQRNFGSGYSVHETHEANGDYVATLLDQDGRSLEAVRVSAEILRFYEQHMKGGAEQLRVQRRRSLEAMAEEMTAAIS